MSDYPQTKQNIVKQAPKRAVYDREIVHAILDDAYVVQVAFVVDGKPQIIPMYGIRVGETMVFHGSRKSRFMRKLADGEDLCLNVTLIDGLLFGRSAFHHSMNYRSVVIHARGRLAREDEKTELAKAVTNRLAAQRYDDVRGVADNEMKATDFLIVPIENVVAKVRTGDPIDDKEDLDLPHWAGEIAIKRVFEAPRSAADLKAGIEVPQYLYDEYGET